MYIPIADSALSVIIAFVIFILFSLGAILVLWVAMPFSVFGVKGLLRKIVEEQERTNRLLAEFIEAGRGKESRPPAEKDEEEPGVTKARE
ncbi:MAG TPA: hypothetical protein DDW94_02285 [Deltaproteobacteria bacterium]|nr:MAG: hypothetical protein A2Z79_09555 [Deltaproteobacteria bacterium GWA2_55_82]OGQ65011.1 MAG: hypothetical protein A3I81_02070 [Deltaproteobacteria bacterium RIFCSPLOWO2_02_FULL_55_12]OIJ73801.1 MAG: hypothetical protein A2V21_305695 [Deltaproteobacteria bacterium GWC2_55_46]HBG45794.1 hypothetical protein [Deltaproteobacteria bacterium]HCY09787.1 hypothetical protein [Deltaproteobacteria bacterium]